MSSPVMLSGSYNPNGNQKTLAVEIEKRIGMVSRAAGITCPGASDWCAAHCYAKHGNYQRFGIQAKYAAATFTKPKEWRNVTRIHGSGDFDSVAYIEQWIAWATESPEKLFYAYTRSWNVPHLLPTLERLRALPNVQLFASIDPTMGEIPPAGWRVAFIEDDSRFDGPTCMEQSGIKASCGDCGYCFRGSRGNVRFVKHSTN